MITARRSRFLSDKNMAFEKLLDLPPVKDTIVNKCTDTLRIVYLIFFPRLAFGRSHRIDDSTDIIFVLIFQHENV